MIASSSPGIQQPNSFLGFLNNGLNSALDAYKFHEASDDAKDYQRLQIDAMQTTAATSARSMQNIALIIIGGAVFTFAAIAMLRYLRG